SKS
ncbi:hypothetical protein BV111_01129B, partial [Haemophilus influenzae]